MEHRLLKSFEGLIGMVKLTGEYQFSNSTLKGLSTEGITLLISQRHNPTPTKPPYFLLRIDSENGREYVSSLFPALKQAKNGLDSYFLDYKGIRYELTLYRQEGKATISETSKSLKGGVRQQNP